MEGRRRARNSGGEHHPADRGQSVLAQISVDVFRRCGGDGFTFIALQRRKRRLFKASSELKTANEFLASLSIKISRYLAPQVYKCIFSGEKDVTIHTSARSLRFSSPTSGFRRDDRAVTARADYTIAQRIFHGDVQYRACPRRDDRQIHRRRILIFFGDPETKGEAEDAKACVRMAFDMQRRLAELNSSGAMTASKTRSVSAWASTRGSAMLEIWQRGPHDYTIIGAEANLAARLQSIAEPGHIVVSYETMLSRATFLSRRRFRPSYEGHQPRGYSLCGQRHFGSKRASRNLQRTHDRTRFFSRPQHAQYRERREHPRDLAGRPQCAGKG